MNVIERGAEHQNKVGQSNVDQSKGDQSKGHRSKVRQSLIMNPVRQYRRFDAVSSAPCQFGMSDLLTEAWQFTRGFKLDFFLGMLLYCAIAYAAMLLIMFIFGMVLLMGAVGIGIQADGFSQDLTNNPLFISAVIGIYITYLIMTMLINIPLCALMSGLFIMAQKRLNGLDIAVTRDLFMPFKVAGKLFLLILLISTLYMVGLLLFILPGLYLLIGSSLSLLLLFAYPNESVLSVFKASFKIVNQQFFKILGLFILLTIINIIAMIPLGIGLIWSLPFSYLCISLLVQKVIVVECDGSRSISQFEDAISSSIRGR